MSTGGDGVKVGVAASFADFSCCVGVVPAGCSRGGIQTHPLHPLAALLVLQVFNPALLASLVKSGSVASTASKSESTIRSSMRAAEAAAVREQRRVRVIRR
jgi:hypothetical protein